MTNNMPKRNPRSRWYNPVAFACCILLLLGATALADVTPQGNEAQTPRSETQEDQTNEKKGKKKQKDKAHDEDKAEPEPSEDNHESNYFGISTQGKEIIYVLDNSNSMTQGRFNAAAAELLKSVKNLREDQSYYVVLFSDTAYRLGHPNPAKGMLKPTEENIKELEYWLGTVELCLKTNAGDALIASLATKPDTIYLLTDGAFTDDTMKRLAEIKSANTRIHTIGMSINKGKAKEDLEAIAMKFGGEFREVELDGEMKKKYLEPRRKKNKHRGEVWGLTLNQGKK